MVLIEILIVFLSKISLGCFQVYTITIDVNTLYSVKYVFTYYIVNLISTTQSWISFYVHLFVSPTFRKNIKIIIRKICCCKSRNTNDVVPIDNPIATT